VKLYKNLGILLLEDFLEENAGKILICSGLVSYIVGLLNLTSLGSPLFVLFSYVGTILFTSGFMVNFEIFPKKLKSWRTISSVLFFSSALLYTTAVLVLFLDVDMLIKIHRMVPIGGTAWEEGPYQEPLGGPNIQFSRPYAWLFSPLLAIGTIFAIISLVMLYMSKSE
jgi:hypothetical protein